MHAQIMITPFARPQVMAVRKVGGGIKCRYNSLILGFAFCYKNFPIYFSSYNPREWCFVCFVVINPCVLLASWFVCFFVSNFFSIYTPPPSLWQTLPGRGRHPCQRRQAPQNRGVWSWGGGGCNSLVSISYIYIYKNTVTGITLDRFALVFPKVIRSRLIPVADIHVKDDKGITRPSLRFEKKHSLDKSSKTIDIFHRSEASGITVSICYDIISVSFGDEAHSGRLREEHWRGSRREGRDCSARLSLIRR